jgi:hypothetical protein
MNQGCPVGQCILLGYLDWTLYSSTAEEAWCDYSLEIHDTKATKHTNLGMCNLLVYCQFVINNARNEQHKVYSLHFGLTTDKSSGTNLLLRRNRTYSSNYTAITQSTPYKDFIIFFLKVNCDGKQIHRRQSACIQSVTYQIHYWCYWIFLVLARARSGLLATFRSNLFPTVCTYYHYQSTATINILLLPPPPSVKHNTVYY